MVMMQPEKIATVIWRAESGFERCSLQRSENGYRLVGQTLLAEDTIPYSIGYVVTTEDDWTTRHVRLIVDKATSRVGVFLSAREGRWTRGRDPIAELGGCLDVDLAFTPATNTLPIRRLGLRVGEGADVDAAWVRWPELDVVRAKQRYERLAEDRYRFSQEEFSAELTVDPEGLVVAYADIWSAIGRA
jgi:uncharacterized protein